MAKDINTRSFHVMSFVITIGRVISSDLIVTIDIDIDVIYLYICL